MALTLESNYKTALQGGAFQESWLFEIRNNTYTNGSVDTQYIRLGTEEVGSGDTKYNSFIINKPTIRESIDLEKGTAKTGNMTITCTNGTLSNHSAKLSAEIFNGTRFYMNHQVVVYSKVGSISSGDYLKIFTGRVKDIKVNDKQEVTIVIASATPIDFIKIPQYQSASGNYFPVVYGDYKKTVASTASSFTNPVDADADVKMFPVEVDSLADGKYNCLVHKALTNEFLHYPVKDAFRNLDDYPIFAPIEQLSNTNNITSYDDYEGATNDTNRNVMQSELNLKRTYRYRPKTLSTSEIIDSDNVHLDPFLLEELKPLSNAVDISTSSFFEVKHRVTSAANNSNKDAQDFYKIKFSTTKEEHKVTAYSVFISYDVADYTNGFGGSSSQDLYEVSAQCIGTFDGDVTPETESDDAKDANGSYTHTFNFLADYSKSDGNAPASFEIALFFKSINMHNAETSSMTVKIKDVQVIATAEIIDEGTADTESNPLEHQSAVTGIKQLYCGGDGFDKSFSSGTVTNMVDMHRDLLSRFTGRGGSSETPLVNTSNYADLVTARSSWKCEYWTTKEVDVNKLLEKCQFEGGFAFRFRTSDETPQYIYIPNGTITADHKIGLSDISSFSLGVTPVDKLITKRIIKYQRSPINEKHLKEQTSEDTTNSIRTNYNILTNENIATNKLDILIGAIGATNTGSGNRNDGFANYYRYINGVPKLIANIELLNPESSLVGSNYFYGMEVGDFCQFESSVSAVLPMFGGTFSGNSGSKFIVTSITRAAGSLKVTLREI